MEVLLPPLVNRTRAVISTDLPVPRANILQHNPSKVLIVCVSSLYYIIRVILYYVLFICILCVIYVLFAFYTTGNR